MKVREARRILDALEVPAWLDGEVPPLTEQVRGVMFLAPDGSPLPAGLAGSELYTAYRQHPDNHWGHEWMMDGGYTKLSTVYLGVNHGFAPELPIRIFETMIFGFAGAEYQWRYATQAAARAGHEHIRGVLAEILGEPGHPYGHPTLT